MYLVGRDDGTVAEFFVHVMECGSMSCHHSVRGLMNHARAEATTGWWWRRMFVPGVLLQEELDKLPPFPKARGK
jgi:hypothetical protein